MRLNVQYIHLFKIKPDYSIKVTDHVKMLKNRMWDSMHMLVVKRDKKKGFSIISGNDRYDYLVKHTKSKYALCMIDEHPRKTDIRNWLQSFRGLEKKEQVKSFNKSNPTALSIIKCFVKENPRYYKLSLRNRLAVLLLAVRYKKTVIRSMQTKVDDILHNE
ncbi:hypothetical protein [Bacillus sp. E(2018)]|uniref:hypothetical protein n=1 Tax=Bacillus sp. E(2018) TaxID=2502239 RepID=UPI0010F577DD|nr:hypothetical protein [Bacillus sp. E(2018)]